MAEILTAAVLYIKAPCQELFRLWKCIVKKKREREIQSQRIQSTCFCVAVLGLL